MGDKYFNPSKKGEIVELKADLNSKDKDKKKDTVKKVIAAMTVGKDMSLLFTDVLNCIDTKDLELKKLVYLYLINYAKTHQDLAILAVNSFVKDASDKNPLVRALALRTMGCIRVDKIIEHLCQPLRNGMTDKDPYVRKTAAICVAKIFDFNPSMANDQGFLDDLKNLLEDSNPMVVANAIASLAEIQSKTTSQIFHVTTATLSKLLSALGECTEWGQIFILDALSRYTPRESREAENICERVTPRLQHKNSAVTLSTIKVLMANMDHITNQEFVRTTCKRMSQPLVTLLHEKPPEIQFVALRNINIIVQKRPMILQSLEYVKMFFCKYYDPIYVKLEKIEILVKLVSDRNVDQVLQELKEYAQEVDVDFVRKSVRAIGRCAIKLERAAERCINVLLTLIETKVNYVVQEAIIVIKDIFRRYPGTYEAIIAALCENLEELDEPEAKASMIWIIGEYAERIDNADELLEAFLDTFNEEPAVVQLSLLTATIKLFLKRPGDTREMVQAILALATQDADNPDLRDRGFVYWRLLSSDPEAAKTVVLSDKPLITDNTNDIAPSLLEVLVNNIATLASVYHKHPDSFIARNVSSIDEFDDSDSDAEAIDMTQMSAVTVGQDGAPAAAAAAAAPGVGVAGNATAAPAAAPAAAPPAQKPKVDLLGDLIGLGDPTPSPAASTAPASGGVASSLGSGSLLDQLDLGAGSSGSYVLPAAVKSVWLSADKGKGMEVHGAFSRKNGVPCMELTIENKSMGVQEGHAVVFNKNSFGLVPGATLQVPALSPGQSHEVTLALATNGPVQLTNPLMQLQIAMKNNVGVFYFAAMVPLHVLFTENGKIEKADMIEMWKAAVDSSKEQIVSNLEFASVDELVQKLEAVNIFCVARRPEGPGELIYMSLRTCNNIVVLLEVAVNVAGKAVKVVSRARQVQILPTFQEAMEHVLRL